MSQLTGKETALKEMFSVWDKDGHGMIATNELRTVIRNFCFEDTWEKQVQEITSEFEADGTGTIDFPSFLSLLARWPDDDGVPFNVDSLCFLWKMFSAWNKDEHGTIATEEFLSLCPNDETKRLGTVASAHTPPAFAKLQKMTNEADSDGSGTLDFSAFMILMVRTRRNGLLEFVTEMMAVQIFKNSFGRFDVDGSGYVALLDVGLAMDLVQKQGNEFSEEPIPDLTDVDDQEFVEFVLEAYDAAMLRGCESYSRDAFELWLREELLPQRSARNVHTMVQLEQIPEQPQEALGPSALRVEVLKLSGETVVSITIDSVATVGVLSQEIARLIGVPTRLQRLFYAGGMLQPAATLAEVKVVDGASITLIIRPEVTLEYEPYLKSILLENTAR